MTTLTLFQTLSAPAEQVLKWAGLVRGAVPESKGADLVAPRQGFFCFCFFAPGDESGFRFPGRRVERKDL